MDFNNKYLSQKVLLPLENIGIKELGLVAFGCLVSTLLKKGDIEYCTIPFQDIYKVLKELKGQQLFKNWAELRLGPVHELTINPVNTWGDNGSSSTTSASNAFDNKPASWESEKNMKEAILGFSFESPRSICMVSIKWQGECMAKEVEVEVSNNSGYSYSTVMNTVIKSKEPKTDILFTPISGTHFVIRLKGILADKSIVAITRVHVFTESDTNGSSLYVPPRKTLQQLEDWCKFIALNSPDSAIRSTAISAMQHLLLSSASVSLLLQTAIALLTLEERNSNAVGKNSEKEKVTMVSNQCLASMSEQVEVEHKRLLGNKVENQTFKYAFDPTCKHNSLTLSDDCLSAKSTDSEKAYVLVNKGFTSGSASWEFQLTEDREDDERTCFGCAVRPVTDGNYQSSNQLWMYRGYNGSLYARGATVTTSFEKIKTGDIVRCELDMEEGTLSYFVNGVFKGIGFRDLKSDLGTIYPAVCFYGKDRTIKLLSVECAQESNDVEVFLSTLKETESSVGWGSFGNNGSLGFDNKKITVNGKCARYGLSLHPPSNGYSYVNYTLKEGEHDTFVATVAINDDVTVETGSDVTFEVLGDGKVLFTSPVIRTSGIYVPISVDISNVHILQLRCHAKESNTNAHCVWVDPALKIPQPCFYDKEMLKIISNVQPNGEMHPKELAGYLLSMLNQFSTIQLQVMRKVQTTVERVAMSLVEPYCVDVSTRTFVLLTDLLVFISKLITSTKSNKEESSKNKIVSYESIAVCTINLVKVNLRRLVVSRINPETIGIRLIGKKDGSDEEKETTLKPLHSILKSFVDEESVYGDSLGKAASAAIDSGLELFYPTPEERRELLKSITKSGATLEVQFRWPTEVEKNGKDAKGNNKKEEHREYDIRFERVILMLEVEFGNLDWEFMLHGSWSKFIHLVVNIPDSKSSTAIDFLDEGLKNIMSKAGFNNWSFPIGCEDPQIILKIERYLKFNRNERLLSEEGTGWFRIYPRHAGSFVDICNEVTNFLDTNVIDIDEKEKDEEGKDNEEKGEEKEGESKE